MEKGEDLRTGREGFLINLISQMDFRKAVLVCLA